jgi:hypothetical protein
VNAAGALLALGRRGRIGGRSSGGSRRVIIIAASGGDQSKYENQE